MYTTEQIPNRMGDETVLLPSSSISVNDRVSCDGQKLRDKLSGIAEPYTQSSRYKDLKEPCHWRTSGVLTETAIPK